ncbi:MAG: hypothetical protein EOO00_10330 [Chitinophagaceae bacterium]|nr:MAG: hypothetical protein EOO00_10330 [Chitinophagaceae bacterium]
MKRQTIDKLCCPFDKSDLNLIILNQDIIGNVLKGTLECETCKRVYPIVHGVPIMTPDEYRQPAIEHKMMQIGIDPDNI